MTSGIYMIKNLVNNKVYIGSAKNIKERWTEHKKYLKRNNHHSSHLQKAWNKYGADNFEFTIIEVVDNLEELIDREQHYIDKFEAYKRTNGYNICPKAGNTAGAEFYEEFKTVRLGEGNPFYGKTHSKETKKELSKINKGENNCMYGKTHSDEAKLKISKATSGSNNGMYGKKPPNTILSESEVVEIKKDLIKGLTCLKIAEKHKVSRGTIKDIKMGKSWSKVYVEGFDQLKNKPYVVTEEHKKNISKSRRNKSPKSKRTNCKLIESEVREIKIMISQGTRVIDIASKFKVHKDTIGRIKNGTTWSDVKIDE